MEQKIVTHTFEPVFNEDSKVLILGTFPSVKSREGEFYYHHPQNRFWKVIAGLTEESVPVTIQEKKSLLLKHGIALWDVIKSCEIIGSSDSSIKNVVPADIGGLIKKSGIKQLYGNGTMAYKLYMQYCYGDTGFEMIKLPSTSPANAAYSLSKLLEHWKIMMKED